MAFVISNILISLLWLAYSGKVSTTAGVYGPLCETSQVLEQYQSKLHKQEPSYDNDNE